MKFLRVPHAALCHTSNLYLDVLTFVHVETREPRWPYYRLSTCCSSAEPAASSRASLPALYRRYAAGQISADSRIYGIARSALSRSQYVAQAESACREFLAKEFDAPAVGILQPPALLRQDRRRGGRGLCASSPPCCRTGPSSCAYSFSRRRRISFRSSARTWPRRPS